MAKCPVLFHYFPTRIKTGYQCIKNLLHVGNLIRSAFLYVTRYCLQLVFENLPCLIESFSKSYTLLTQKEKEDMLIIEYCIAVYMYSSVIYIFASKHVCIYFTYIYIYTLYMHALYILHIYIYIYIYIYMYIYAYYAYYILACSKTFRL